MDAPQIGFISLGCPKNLVDAERILTQLRAEGYGVSPDYFGADLVIVNTCGFIDSAVEESLDAIGEAVQEHGRVIVTGCLGAKAEQVRTAHPEVLAVTGPHAYEEVMSAVHAELPAPHDPYTSLIPPQGVKLTPRHYAYLKISEGCNHRCTFCVIPAFRGDLVSRPVGEVLAEAERLVDSGVRELLVVSQDTSAYGVDSQVSHRLLERPSGANPLDRTRRGDERPDGVDTAALRLSLSPCRRADPADGGGQTPAIPRHATAARQLQGAAGDEAAGGDREGLGAFAALARYLSRPGYPLDIYRGFPR